MGGLAYHRVAGKCLLCLLRLEGGHVVTASGLNPVWPSSSLLPKVCHISYLLIAKKIEMRIV